ncbi:MAG TPA: mechanosensitive ion channel domain-containing protein [Bacteroidales bacterium]|nr:mechanosensitive ion channel domain-containing protein [Bacteroidales bacterium]
MTTEELIDQAIQFAVDYGPKLLGAIIVLIIGSWVIRLAMGGMTRMMDKSSVDDSLKPFLKTVVKTLFRALLFISVLGMVGIEMTSFIALLGAAGLAVGMALSGTLQNFAGGVIILLFKPYKVGDYIEAQGYAGSVKEIQIFNTVLKTPDAKIVIIPNGSLSNSSMINYSAEEQRRVEWTFGIAYGDNVKTAKQVIRNLLDADERVLKDPEPFLAIASLGDSSVNIVVRVWVSSSEYWGLFFDMNELVYEAFNDAGINIPFPQMDVHLHENK